MPELVRIICDKCGIEDEYSLAGMHEGNNTITCRWCRATKFLTEVVRKDAHLAAMEEQAKLAAEKAQAESEKIGNNLHNLHKAMQAADEAIQEMLKGSAESMQSQFDALKAQQMEQAEAYERIHQERAEGQAAKGAILQREAEEYKANGQFEEAAKNYQKLIDLYPNEADYHWQLAVCLYGIEYVKEASSDIYVPTLTHCVFDPMRQNPHYRSACELATREMRAEYESRAKLIDDLLSQYNRVQQEEAPYDVFISVKQGDAKQRPTQDSVDAQDLYYKLAELKKKNGENLRVFNSRITLSQFHAGSEFEPYIIHALTTASILIVVCSEAEYINAPWVRNEWRRFLYLMRQDPGRKLILYNGMQEDSAIPAELRGMQYVRKDKLDSFGEIKGALKQLLEADVPSRTTGQDDLARQTEEIRKLLLQRDFHAAEEKAAALLQEKPFNAKGNVLMLMAKTHARVEMELRDSDVPLEEFEEYIVAMDSANRVGDEPLLNRLRKYNEAILRRIHGATEDLDAPENSEAERGPSPDRVEQELEKGQTLMRASADQACVLRTDIPKDSISSVIFLDTLGDAPGDAWDVSAAEDRSVLCWARGAELFVAGEGGVRANQDSTGLFSGWGNMESVRFEGNFDTSGAVSMRGMFSDCISLKELDVSDFDTSRVADMSFMFNRCTGLTRLNIAGFDTSGAVDMRWMFNDCGKLAEVDVSGFNTSNVTNVNSMFKNCVSLMELNLSGFDLSRVTDVQDMLAGCVKLNRDPFKLRVKKTVAPVENPTSGVSASQPAKKPMLMQVTKDQKFALCTNVKKQAVTSVTFLDSFESAPSNAVDVSANRDQSVLCWSRGTNLFIAGRGGVRANTNSSCLFEGWKALKTIRFDGHFDTVGVTSMRNMFQNCSRLTALDVLGFDTSKVTDMGFMFDKCASLTILDVSDFDTSSVTDMSSMFQGCTKLLALNLSRFDTSKVTEMDFMFNQCLSLKTLDISHFDTSRVTNMGRMFQNCISLKELDVSRFNTSNVTNMCSMFSRCESLTELEVSHFDTSRVRDMSGMFALCKRMSRLDPFSFSKASLQYYEGMFNGCGGFFFSRKLQSRWEKL